MSKQRTSLREFSRDEIATVIALCDTYAKDQPHFHHSYGFCWWGRVRAFELGMTTDADLVHDLVDAARNHFVNGGHGFGLMHAPYVTRDNGRQPERVDFVRRLSALLKQYVQETERQL